jgi:hypothetical protein
MPTKLQKRVLKMMVGRAKKKKKKTYVGHVTRVYRFCKAHTRWMLVDP